MRRLALLLLFFAAPALAQTGTVQLLDWRAPVPANWKSQPPSSNMRLAQFVAPAKAGEAEIAIFYFGQKGAGPLEAVAAHARGFRALVEGLKPAR